MATINGTPEKDLLRGTPEADSIFGLAGNDRLSGNQGNDRVFGGRGDDRVYGGRGEDSLSGGVGDDTLRAFNGSDRLSGGTGNDLLFGGIDSDRLNGGDGNDTLTGSSSLKGQIDTLTGGVGSDLLILGDETKVFYDDRNSATAGGSNYALVTGFNTSDDVIQLNGTKNDYVLAESPNNLPGGTAVYLDKPEGEPDELIGIVQGSTNLSLDGDYFSFTDTGAPGAEFNLADLDGSNGFVINGIDAGDFSTFFYAVSDAGDVNGDGFDDIILGASSTYSNGQFDASKSYVVFGKGEGFDASFDLSRINGSNGFVINGIDELDRSGFSVSTAGDVNGDGFDDIIIGAPDADPNGQNDAGESYVVFGKKEGFDASLNLSDLNGSNGFVINGIGINAYDNSGTSVSTAGDVNGDSFDDIIIGAPNANYNTGSSYVVFGKGEEFDPSLNLSDLDGSNGFVINDSNAYDNSGISVSTAGNVNGDGFDDIIVGNSGAVLNGQFDVGVSYVVFGQGEGFDASFDPSTLNGSNGFVINGIDGGDRSGISVSTAGDVNGDDIDDIIIGAVNADPNGQTIAGESYVVFGQSEGFDASLNLSDLNGSNGFVLNGIDVGDVSGFSVSTAGDFNGDGFDDLIIGAFDADPNGQYGAGESYVVFGKEGGFDASLNLSDLNGSNGFVINGINELDLSGFSVSTAGDINDDHFDDLIIGSGGAAQSYVIFGSDLTAATFDVGTLEPINQSLASNAVIPTGQNWTFGSTTTADNLFFNQPNAGISPFLVGTDIT